MREEFRVTALERTFTGHPSVVRLNDPQSSFLHCLVIERKSLLINGGRKSREKVQQNERGVQANYCPSPSHLTAADVRVLSNQPRLLLLLYHCDDHAMDIQSLPSAVAAHKI